MSVSVTVAGTTYTIPEVGDVSWGPQVTAWIQAISAVTLQTAGGNFTLTSDLNFGGSFGLIAKYYTSFSTNSAATGVLRLANSEFINWRNAANNADIGIDLDSSNIFQFGSAINSSGNVTGLNLSGSNSGDLTLGSFGSTPNGNGASLSGQALTLQPADGTHGGGVSTTTQTFAGAKTFSTSVISSIHQSGSANPAASGIFRLANSDAIAFRNIGNSADILLQPHADGILQYNSIDLVNLSATQTLTGKTLAAGSNTITGLTNSNFSGSAGMTGANMAASTVANSNLATMAANTVKANVTGSSANPTDVSLVSAATASAAMIRDANANVLANNFIESFTTQATAGSTTALSVSSTAIQQFTGSSNQTITLPDCTTLATGFAFYITNRSTGTLSVNNKGGSLQQTMATNSSIIATCTSIGSSNGTWDIQYVSNTSFTNPMTTAGDIIYGGSSGTPARLANGSANQILTSQGSTNAPIWQYPAFNIQFKSTTYSAVINDYVLASGSSFTITLPTAVGVSGQQIAIQHNGTSLSQLYTLNTTSSQTIGGVASGSYVLYTNGETLTLVSDGSNWQIVNHKTTTGWIDGGAISVSNATGFAKGTVLSGFDHFWWRREGSTMYCQLIYLQGTAGTGGSGAYAFTIPGSQIIDTTKLFATNSTSSSVQVTCGSARVNVSGVQSGIGNLYAFDSTHVAIVAGLSSSPTTIILVGGGGYSFGESNLTWGAEGNLPMVGWQP